MCTESSMNSAWAKLKFQTGDIAIDVYVQYMKNQGDLNSL